MALPSYTLADLALAIKHALGRDPDSRTSTTIIANNALAYLVRGGPGHPWNWRKRARALSFAAVAITTLARASNVITVTKTAHGLAAGDVVRIAGATSGFNAVFTIDTVPTADTFTVAQTGADETATTQGSYLTGHVALPSDFAELLAVTGTDVTRYPEPTTIEDLELNRQANTAAPTGRLCYCLRWSSQASATAAPIARLELYPVPDAAAAGILRVSYLRTIPVLSGATDVADIPPHLNPLLWQLCRAFAISDERLMQGEDWRRASEMLKDELAADGRAQPQLGRLTNQLAPYGPGRSDWNFNPIVEVTH